MSTPMLVPKLVTSRFLELCGAGLIMQHDGKFHHPRGYITGKMYSVTELIQVLQPLATDTSRVSADSYLAIGTTVEDLTHPVL